MRKLIMKTKICKTDIMCLKNEQTNKSNFVRMRCKAAQIILKTCKCLFRKRSVEKLLLSNVTRVSRNGNLLSLPNSAIKVIFS